MDVRQHWTRTRRHALAIGAGSPVLSARGVKTGFEKCHCAACPYSKSVIRVWSDKLCFDCVRREEVLDIILVSCKSLKCMSWDICSVIDNLDFVVFAVCVCVQNSSTNCDPVLLYYFWLPAWDWNWFLNLKNNNWKPDSSCADPPRLRERQNPRVNLNDSLQHLYQRHHHQFHPQSVFCVKPSLISALVVLPKESLSVASIQPAHYNPGQIKIPCSS